MITRSQGPDSILSFPANIAENDVKFQSLEYINIKICAKLTFEDSVIAHVILPLIKSNLEVVKNYLSSKCPNLKNPIQVKMYQIDSWSIAELESKEI